MPTPMDAMLGMVTAAIGFLILVVGFSIQEPKKRMLSYILAGVVIFLGSYHYIASEMRVIEMRRRIANIQRQQQVNLEEIQRRLKETQEKTPVPAKK